MIITGLTDKQYRDMHMFLVAERRRTMRRVERLIKNECGVGFSLVSGCSLTKVADNVAADNNRALQ